MGLATVPIDKPKQRDQGNRSGQKNDHLANFHFLSFLSGDKKKRNARHQKIEGALRRHPDRGRALRRGEKQAINPKIDPEKIFNEREKTGKGDE